MGILSFLKSKLLAKSSVVNMPSVLVKEESISTASEEQKVAPGVPTTNNSNLSQTFYSYLKNNSSRIHAGPRMNFVRSHVNTSAAFIPGDELYSGIFAIHDDYFNILYSLKVSAYIFACGISDSGRFAIFNTANADSDDGGKCFFIDVLNKKILWIKPLLENWKSVCGFHIDESTLTIYVIHEDYKVQYSFDGNIKNEEVFFKQKLTMSDYSPYDLNNEATQIIEHLMSTSFDGILLRKALELLRVSASNPKMSKYQLSLTYKKLGELYLANEFKEDALKSFQKGLAYNPKLPVKRLIKSLQGDIEK